jgi:hypothetical protein
MLNDAKWVDEFTGEDELARTARNLHNSVNDPKFANSQVFGTVLL